MLKKEEEEENVERNCCLGEAGCLKSDLSLPLLSPPFSCQGREGGEMRVTNRVRVVQKENEKEDTRSTLMDKVYKKTVVESCWQIDRKRKNMK